MKQNETPSPYQKYFFKATICRKDNDTPNATTKEVREGSLYALSHMQALDAIAQKSIEVWKSPLLRIEMYEIGDNGELEMVSTVKDRVNCVLSTNKALRPNHVKHWEQRMDVATQAVKPEEKKVNPPTPSWQQREPTKFTWPGLVGTFAQRPNFATLKLNKGAFK